MRLIDADELMKEFEENGTWWEQARLEEAPTIDAVPVVRCKDCKYIKLVGRRPFMIYCCGNDKGLGDSIKETDYCSYGVRKDDNNDKN